MLGGDLSRHHRGGGSTLLGGLNKTAKLTDFHPVNLVDERGEGRIGFPFKGGSDDFLDTSFASTLHGKLGVGTVTGYQEEGIWNLHGKLVLHRNEFLEPTVNFIFRAARKIPDAHHVKGRSISLWDKKITHGKSPWVIRINLLPQTEALT